MSLKLSLGPFLFLPIPYFPPPFPVTLTTLKDFILYNDTFFDTLKLLKYRIPISIFELFKSSPRDVNIRLLVPRVKLDLTKVNFLFQASCIWNELVPKLMNTCIPNPLGIMVPGSTEGSDLSTSIAVLKKKLRVVLLNTQKIDPLSSILGWSRSNEWYPENFFKAHYPA